MALPQRPRADRTPAWQALQQVAAGGSIDLRAAFAADPERFAAFSQEAPHLFADLSKNLIDRDVEALLFELAEQRGVAERRDAMFAGVRVNTTEQRAALHYLLRFPAQAKVDPSHVATKNGAIDLVDALAQVHETLDAMLAYAESVRADSAITDVVNIGIGGSDLGPQMAVQALDAFAVRGKRFHFVSNVDGHELAAVLRQIEPRHTLFLIASKTFTTFETMTNARSARAWFEAAGGRDIARHFVALTTHVAAADEFGITTTFGFWDWVGGRYSLWSAIGLPIAIAIGDKRFRELLAGAHAMD
ncbi:MAG: glucose-6-phosphate isomerase, partial [Proteobacteria bacterium]|nr:glucose-6-phosphate isomerase [Pseudomonadota bacterium]